MTTYQAVEEKLEHLIPGYEARLPQQQLAEANVVALSSGTHLLAEAGCGTGKSFANLIPAINWTTEEGVTGEPRRVVYATATKALQDQIVAKDLPNLQSFYKEQFGVEFSFALLKGRSNYLCMNRAEGADGVENLSQILKIANEAPEGFQGEKVDFETELGHEMSFGDWAKVRATSDDCSSNGCSKNHHCFADRARGRAADAQIVVVNHAILFADLLYFNAMLGSYSAVIFDEAHEARDYARNALTNEFTEGSLRSLLAEVRNHVKRNYPKSEQAILEASKEASTAQTALFLSLLEMPELARGNSARLVPSDFADNQNVWADFAMALQSLSTALGKAAPSLATAPSSQLDKDEKRFLSLQKRAVKLAQSVMAMIMAKFDDLVRWVEVDGKGADRKVTIKSCPIDVAPWLSEALFSQVPCILTSATLQVNGKFDFIASKLGIEEFAELNVGTPFDFSTQAKFFVPNLPDPGKERAAFNNAAINEMLALVKASKGRALLLFTSISSMRAAFDTLSDLLPYTCLMQGQGSNKSLAKEFMADTHSVLFATKSFMTGVDFQGDTCSLVVVDKLPFPVPTEPMFQAESEWIKARGGNDFAELSIPMMSLILSQAFGRLIRHRSDRGVFALLDPRVCSKNYGKQILATLPQAPLTRDRDEVVGFFA